MTISHPILYSFRRCPYAIRARLAIKISQTQVVLREVVLADNFKANAINIALENSIPAVSLVRSGFSSRKEFEGKMIKVLEGYTPDLIVLAGFMRILSKNFIKTFPRKIINIHPAQKSAY